MTNATQIYDSMSSLLFYFAKRSASAGRFCMSLVYNLYKLGVALKRREAVAY
jgi:hypothetical protein